MSPRSLTGNHAILPSNSKQQHFSKLDSGSKEAKVNVALAKLSGVAVMWRIWPAVLLHTAFAALIVLVSEYTTVKLDIPNIMLTLLGVVIGFVISLRVSSGYDRYWWGRCAWSDLIKNSRTISRLIWVHVPPRLGKGTNLIDPDHPPSASEPPSPEEVGQVMREKRMMMNLIEAFAVSLKHYVRGELGIYYEDMYHIVRPFHEHRPHSGNSGHHDGHGHAQNVEEHSATAHQSTSSLPTAVSSHTHLSTLPISEETALVSEPPVIAPVISYGSTSITKSRTTHQSLKHTSSNVSLASSASDLSIREPLLPADLSLPDSSPSPDLMPFGSFFMHIGHYVNPYTWYTTLRTHFRKGSDREDEEVGNADRHCGEPDHHSNVHMRRRRTTRQIHRIRGKHRPRLAGDGDNLPLEILRCMSEWVSVLEARDVVSGSAIGGIYGCLAAYEDILGSLERILTTPLPYVYSQHISTVWLYLFFLPFQLAEEFDWYTVPGVAVAAFFYLGFLAAGDEIEQPFGYDEDDLDLDLFCREIIKADLQMLMATPCPNAPMGSQQSESDIVESRTVVELCVEKSVKKGKHVSTNADAYKQT